MRSSNSQVYQGKAPNLPICSGSKPFSEAPLFRNSVIAVLVDATNDELNLLGGEEVLVCLLDGLIREVDEEDVACCTKHYSQKTLDDEDPAPAGEAS